MSQLRAPTIQAVGRMFSAAAGFGERGHQVCHSWNLGGRREKVESG